MTQPKKRFPMNAPSVTQQDIESNISTIEVVTKVTASGQILRWAVINMKNGFSVTGDPSAAVSPENDDPARGEEYAIANAKREIWKLMGFALKQKLYEQGKDFKERMDREHYELDQRVQKLTAFFNDAQFATLDQREQADLMNQHHHMKEYRWFLGRRIGRLVAPRG